MEFGKTLPRLPRWGTPSLGGKQGKKGLQGDMKALRLCGSKRKQWDGMGTEGESERDRAARKRG